jgi:alkylhydroperoxidase/carboxymuconolactone decarboxylase family protein YurZ
MEWHIKQALDNGGTEDDILEAIEECLQKQGISILLFID